ncbi:MAG TPA: DUF6496 domain-containing protein [Candidatus Angelobacter sp.]
MGAKTRTRMRPSKRKYSKYPKAAKHPVKKRKQAIAFGLAKARKKGKKFPSSRGHAA